MKKIGPLCFLFVIVLVFSACALNKTPITAHEFSSKVNSLGFTVRDVTGQYEGQTVTSLVAIDSGENYQIEFHVVSTQAQANGAFNRIKNSLEGIGTGSGRSLSRSFSGNNWASFSKTAGGTFGFVSYIGNTFIYAHVPEKYQKAVRDVIKELESSPATYSPKTTFAMEK